MQHSRLLTLKRPAGVLWDPSIASASGTLDLNNIYSQYFVNLSPSYRSMFMSTESRFIFVCMYVRVCFYVCVTTLVPDGRLFTVLSLDRLPPMSFPLDS